MGYHQSSGNHGEDLQQNPTKKTVDGAVDQIISQSALIFCDLCLRTLQEDVDWRSYVAKYNIPLEVRHDIPHLQSQSSHDLQFPLKLERPVWILKPSIWTVLGPYKINRAFANHRFELKGEGSGVIDAEEVEARFLRRDPNAKN